MRNELTLQQVGKTRDELFAVIDDLVTIFGCVQSDIAQGGIREPAAGLVREIVSGRMPKITVGNFDVFGDSSIG